MKLAMIHSTTLAKASLISLVIHSTRNMLQARKENFDLFYLFTLFYLPELGHIESVTL